jgi:dolichyl-phosphate-mannose--protein O-mannosyl transferase
MFYGCKLRLAVGWNGTIIRTTNGGTNWSLQTSLTTKTLESVSFTDANTGTIVGQDTTILRTTNGGTNLDSSISHWNIGRSNSRVCLLYRYKYRNGSWLGWCNDTNH